MNEFLRFVSFLIAVTGCVIVGGTLALKGASLLTVAVRTAITLAILWFVLRFLAALINVAAGPVSDTGRSDAEDADTETMMAEAS